MYDYRIVEQVSRKKKHMSGALRKVMVIFAVLFVLMGITISQAFMLPGFLLALLYFVYDIFSQRDYEYTMENGELTIVWQPELCQHCLLYTSPSPRDRG